MSPLNRRSLFSDLLSWPRRKGNERKQNRPGINFLPSSCPVSVSGRRDKLLARLDSHRNNATERFWKHLPPGPGDPFHSQAGRRFALYTMRCPEPRWFRAVQGCARQKGSCSSIPWNLTFTVSEGGHTLKIFFSFYQKAWSFPAKLFQYQRRQQ